MDVENILAENAALKRKLQSKTEALLILNHELNKCKEEKNHLKNSSEKSFYEFNKQKSYFQSPYRFEDCTNCKQLESIKRINASLKFENEELKQQLISAQGDIKVLRQEKKDNNDRENSNWHGREALVTNLETVTERVKHLETDIATLLDEKQELVSERDSYRCKVHRLNHQISNILRAPNIDIDSLIMENKCLHDRLDQALADKDLLCQSLNKYKAMLEKKRNKGSVQLGSVASCDGMVVTHKQVQELLESQMNNTEATLADLRSLCLAMLESLQDKSLALTHHKKTTKLLANRIEDLEALLTKDSETILFPSKAMMDKYCSSNVDKDLDKLPPDDICDYCSETPKNDRNREGIEEDPSDSQNDSEDTLPPDLRKLVYKAIQDINKSDSKVIE